MMTSGCNENAPD